MCRTREPEVERESRYIVGPIAKASVRDPEAKGEPVLMQRRSRARAKAAGKVEGGKPRVACERGKRYGLADTCGQTFAHRIHARRVARGRCGQRSPADHCEDLQSALVALEVVGSGEHGARDSMHTAMHACVEEPRAGPFARRAERVRDRVAIEAQRRAVVAVVGRMRHTIRFVGVKEQDRIRIGDDRSSVALIPKDAAPRKHECR